MQPTTLLLTLCSAVAVTALPSTYIFKGFCCFSLQDTSSSNIVQQDTHSGYLSLNSGHSNGWYCLNSNRQDTVLRDGAYNACILDYRNQFQCLDPTPGSDIWTVKRTGGKTVLQNDGSQGFSACSSAKGEMLYGSNPPGDAKCRKLTQLAVVGMQGACNGF